MRSPNGRLLIGMLVVAMAFMGAALRAEEPTPSCANLPALTGGLPAFLAQAGRGSIEDPSQQSSCTANCWDGSTVACSGTSCSAHDSNCSSNFRGYCTGSTTGTRYCPVCPPTCSAPCSATTICANGVKLRCDGCSGDCFSFYQCYVYCDGSYTFCPDLGGQSCPL